MVNINDNPAFQQGVAAEAGDVEVIAYSAGNLPVVNQQPVDIGNEPLDVSGATVTVAQQSAVKVADSTGATIDPSEQGSFDVVYTDIDLTTTGTTTILDESGQVSATGIGLVITGNAAVEVRITDGTDSAAIFDGKGGESVELTNGPVLSADDDIEIEVTKADSNAGTKTAYVSRRVF